MQKTKPEVSQLTSRSESSKTVESKKKTVIQDIRIEDEKWRESQVEDPERWDGMS